jgi:hypothetical protein
VRGPGADIGAGVLRRTLPPDRTDGVPVRVAAGETRFRNRQPRPDGHSFYRHALSGQAGGAPIVRSVVNSRRRESDRGGPQTPGRSRRASAPRRATSRIPNRPRPGALARPARSTAQGRRARAGAILGGPRGVAVRVASRSAPARAPGPRTRWATQRSGVGLNRGGPMGEKRDGDAEKACSAPESRRPSSAGWPTPPRREGGSRDPGGRGEDLRAGPRAVRRRTRARGGRGGDRVPTEADRPR